MAVRMESTMTARRPLSILRYMRPYLSRLERGRASCGSCGGVRDHAREEIVDRSLFFPEPIAAERIHGPFPPSVEKSQPLLLDHPHGKAT